jgi:hypothetical protein
LPNFGTSQTAGFYTGKSHEPLISRAKPLFDASIPQECHGDSSLAAASCGHRKDEYHQRGEKSCAVIIKRWRASRSGLRTCSARWISTRKPKEIVVVGERDAGHGRVGQRNSFALFAQQHLAACQPNEPLEKISPLLRENPGARESNRLCLPKLYLFGAGNHRRGIEQAADKLKQSQEGGFQTRPYLRISFRHLPIPNLLTLRSLRTLRLNIRIFSFCVLCGHSSLRLLTRHRRPDEGLNNPLQIRR